MKKVLLTGGSGFIGRNIIPILKEECELYAPTRNELNLKDQMEVKEYLTKHQFDCVIHSANPNPAKNVLDQADTMFEDSLKVFMNLFNCRELYRKMIFLGSGAEYDKRFDIVLAEETRVGNNIPEDSYGLAKMIMNDLAKGSSNVYNFRIFACFGPTDHESKFITHAIRCCMKNEDITIRQNCYFDYMHVTDLGKILLKCIDRDLKYHDYNVCTSKRYTLLEIAEMVKAEMESKCEIKILKDGMNNEYTGSNKRLLNEIGEYKFLDLHEGIKIQIESELHTLENN